MSETNYEVCEVKEVLKTVEGFSGCQMQALFLGLQSYFGQSCVTMEYLGEVDTDYLMEEIAENRDCESRDFLIDLFKTFTPLEDAHLVHELNTLIDKAETEDEADATNTTGL